MIPTLILWFTLLTLRPSTRPIQAPSPSPQEKEIQSVIQQQLDAFTFNDSEEAYRLASKNIKDHFSQDQYMEMVRTEYPQITKSLRVSFGEVHFNSDPIHATVRVEITGFSHKKVAAEYRMIQEEGGWKVDGITILPVRARGPIERGRWSRSCRSSGSNSTLLEEGRWRIDGREILLIHSLKEYRLQSCRGGPTPQKAGFLGTLN